MSRLSQTGSNEKPEVAYKCSSLLDEQTIGDRLIFLFEKPHMTLIVGLIVYEWRFLFDLDHLHA